MLADVVTLLVIATLMLTVEWRLALMLLLLQPPLTWLVITLQQRYRKANYRVREELSQLNADLQENLQGLEVVQMFRRERLNSERALAAPTRSTARPSTARSFSIAPFQPCWSGCR